MIHTLAALAALAAPAAPAAPSPGRDLRSDHARPRTPPRTGRRPRPPDHSTGSEIPGFVHGFPFDPAYGYPPARLLGVSAPPAPAGFDGFWRARYAAARAVAPEPRVGPVEVEDERDGVRVHRVTYASTGGIRTGGWLVLPADGRAVTHGFVIGHGYGGRDTPAPELPLPLAGAAALLPCVRGMGRLGRLPGIPDTADAHVLHGISARDTYVLGDCVADLWCAASALLELVPELAKPGAPRLGYVGESFGGGSGRWPCRGTSGSVRPSSPCPPSGTIRCG